MGVRSDAEVKANLHPDVDTKFMRETLAYQTYAGDPTNNVVPRYIGDDCLDTSNNAWYRSHGTTNVDWKKLTP